MQMHYLDATISENLRMFPPILESGRCCTKDCTGLILFICPIIFTFKYTSFLHFQWMESSFQKEPEFKCQLGLLITTRSFSLIQKSLFQVKWSKCVFVKLEIKVFSCFREIFERECQQHFTIYLETIWRRKSGKWSIFIKKIVKLCCFYLWFLIQACIGQRFAITEIKICMAKLLNKFYIKPTKVADLEYHKGSIGFLSYNDFKVEFVPRND